MTEISENFVVTTETVDWLNPETGRVVTIESGVVLPNVESILAPLGGKHRPATPEDMPRLTVV